MIEQEAVIAKLEGDQAWLRPLTNGGCSGCLQQSSCATSVLSKALPKREFAVQNNFGLKTGDKVTMAADESQLLSGSFLLYLLPLFVMLLVVIVSDYLLSAASAELWLPAIAVSSLLLAFRLIHRLQAYLLYYFCGKLLVIARKN